MYLQLKAQGAEEPNLTFTRSIFELCTRAVSCVIRSVVFEFSPQRDPKRNRRFPSEARSAEKKKRLSSYCVTILRRPQSAVCGYPTESSDYAWGPGGAKNRLENNRSNIERVKVKFGSSAPCAKSGSRKHLRMRGHDYILPRTNKLSVLSGHLQIDAFLTV